MTLRRLGLSALCLSLTIGGTAAVATPPAEYLPLGPANLTETRDTRTLQPGVTLTTIVRGHTDPAAGVDNQGRTVLITADGRNVNSLGLSIAEAAAAANSFHLQEAINLDGGGSTTMVADGTVLNTPSDTAGERPVGDALVITK